MKHPMIKRCRNSSITGDDTESANLNDSRDKNEIIGKGKQSKAISEALTRNSETLEWAKERKSPMWYVLLQRLFNLNKWCTNTRCTQADENRKQSISH